MSIKALQELREQAWIPTPLGDKFSLYFDDELYLKLVVKHIADSITEVSGTFNDHEMAKYMEGFNDAIKAIKEGLENEYKT